MLTLNKNEIFLIINRLSVKNIFNFSLTCRENYHKFYQNKAFWLSLLSSKTENRPKIPWSKLCNNPNVVWPRLVHYTKIDRYDSWIQAASYGDLFYLKLTKIVCDGSSSPYNDMLKTAVNFGHLNVVKFVLLDFSMYRNIWYTICYAKTAIENNDLPMLKFWISDPSSLTIPKSLLLKAASQAGSWECYRYLRGGRYPADFFFYHCDEPNDIVKAFLVTCLIFLSLGFLLSLTVIYFFDPLIHL